MIYTSIDNPQIKDIKKLQIKKYRDKEQLFLVEGEHLIVEALNSGNLKEVILEEGNPFSLNVPIKYVSKKVLKYLSQLETPTVIGVCKMNKSLIRGDKIVVLDSIQDPGNLGTIIRSCVAFNIETLILINCVDQYNPKVLRSTQGLLFHLNIINSDYEIIKSLKEQGFHVYGTVADGNNLKAIAKYKKFVIIMGNEGNGLSTISKDLCDEYIFIETDSRCESLNVGVATSIILYEISR